MIEEYSDLNSTKQSCEDISQDIRDITVKKLAEEVDSRIFECMGLREDTEKLEIFVKKIEAEIFEKVKSRNDYFYSVASKIVDLKSQLVNTLIVSIYEVEKTNFDFNSGSFNKKITNLKSTNFKELRQMHENEPLNLNSQEPHKFWINQVVHASNCKSRRCTEQTCHRLKQSVQHSRNCQIRMNGGCNVCNRLIALCRNHEHACKEENCDFPFCFSIKQKKQFQNVAQR